MSAAALRCWRFIAAARHARALACLVSVGGGGGGVGVRRVRETPRCSAIKRPPVRAIQRTDTLITPGYAAARCAPSAIIRHALIMPSHALR